MKKVIVSLLILSFVFSFTACNSDEITGLKNKISEQESQIESLEKELNVYKESEKVKEAEKDEIKSDVIVTLSWKDNIESENGKFFLFEYTVKNNTEKDILAIKGYSVFYDVFGDRIFTYSCDFTDEIIPPGSSIKVKKTEKNRGMYISSEFDEKKLQELKYETLEMRYSLSCVVFTDGTKVYY